MRNFWKRVGSFAQWKQSVNGLMSVGQRRSESKVEVGLKQHEQRKMLDTLSCWLAKIKHDVPHRMMMMITMIMMMMMCLQEVRSWWTCLVKWLATVQSWLLMKLKRSPAVNCHTLDVTVNSHSSCQVCLSVCLSVTHYIQVDKSQVGDVFLCVSASLCISLCFCVGLSVCLCVTLCISVCLCRFWAVWHQGDSDRPVWCRRLLWHLSRLARRLPSLVQTSSEWTSFYFCQPPELCCPRSVSHTRFLPTLTSARVLITQPLTLSCLRSDRWTLEIQDGRDPPSWILTPKCKNTIFSN